MISQFRFNSKINKERKLGLFDSSSNAANLLIQNSITSRMEQSLANLDRDTHVRSLKNAISELASSFDQIIDNTTQ